VRLGGPVSPEQVWLVYKSEDRFGDVEGQFEVTNGIMASASRRILELVAQGTAPKSLVGLVGYAGWAPSQLENEIGGGAWLPTDVDARIVFDGPPDQVWQRAYERVGTTPMAFNSRTVGSA
jgi:putative transcriptional regulator